MIFRPVVHPVLLVLIVLVAAALVFLSAKRAARKRVTDIVRRSFIVLVVIIMGSGPSIPGEALEVSSSLEVYLVIDLVNFFKPRINFSQLHSDAPMRSPRPFLKQHFPNFSGRIHSSPPLPLRPQLFHRKGFAEFNCHRIRTNPRKLRLPETVCPIERHRYDPAPAALRDLKACLVKFQKRRIIRVGISLRDRKSVV